MPTYEYLCRKCDTVFERFQSMTEEPVKTCEQCGGEVERLIGAGAGLIFKGSGFYATDYKKPSPKKESKQESTKKEVSSPSKKNPDNSTQPGCSKE